MTSIGQNYSVYYSGSSTTLERFTITSLQPIFGQWHIMIEKYGIEQKDLENSTYVKIKYIQENASLVSSTSK